MKKILALVVAALLVLSMTAAYAADPVAITDGIAYDANGLTEIDVTVNFTPATGVTTPAHTFSYTLEPADGDASSNPIVYEGVGTVDATAVFAAGETESTATLDLSGLTGFTHAGVYRYTLTQAAISDEDYQAGISSENSTDGQAAVEKYMDLYVDNTGKIISAVLFEEVQTLSATGTSVTYTKKTDEFNNTYGEGDHGTKTFTLKKVVAGGMGDTNDTFPFTFKAEYAGSTATLLDGVTYTIADSSNGTTTGSTAAIGATVDITLGHNETIVITVPNMVKVTVVEGEHATDEGYTIVATQTGAATVTGVTQTLTDNSSDITVADTGSVIAINDADATMTYTNTRESISPTGVVLRFAPYFAMLAGGMLLVLLAVKRRKSDED